MLGILVPNDRQHQARSFVPQAVTEIASPVFIGYHSQAVVRYVLKRIRNQRRRTRLSHKRELTRASSYSNPRKLDRNSIYTLLCRRSEHRCSCADFWIEQANRELEECKEFRKSLERPFIPFTITGCVTPAEDEIPF